MRLFLLLHPEVSIRQAQGLSRARASGLTRERANEYFQVLEEQLVELDILDKPQNIFNMDETGCPMNNKTEKVLAQKGSKVVYQRTNVERGENVTVVTCANATGSFIPPMAIFKGKRYRSEFALNMPPGAVVTMTESGYSNEEQFLKWLSHFQLHRPTGPCLLILDGHASHTKNMQAIEFCNANEITIVCLPSHTTHALQPLDRSFFGPFKVHYKHAFNSWIRQNPGIAFTKPHFGTILRDAWNKSAIPENAINGFKVCGIFPFNPDNVPSHLFAPNEAAEASDISDTNIAKELLPSPKKTVSPTRRGLQNSFVVTAIAPLATSPPTQTDVQETDPNDDVPCTFCRRRFSEPLSSKFSQWVECMKCHKWFHEVCVGAQGITKFICGLCS